MEVGECFDSLFKLDRWCWLHLTPSPAQEALLQRCHDAVSSFLALGGAATALTGKRATFHEHLLALSNFLHDRVQTYIF